MRRWALTATLSVLCGCFDFRADYAACLDAGTCVDLVAPGQCEGPVFPGPTACANDRDLYLAPDGDDAAPGTRAAPRRSLAGVTLVAGDRVHFLAGRYTTGFTLRGDGVSDCPVTVEGDPAMTSIMQTRSGAEVTVLGSHWRVSQLVIEGAGYGNGSSGISVRGDTQVSGVSLQRIEFRVVDSIQSIAQFEGCTGCSVIASRVVSDGGYASSAVQAWQSPGFLFQGNSVQGETHSTAVFVHDSEGAVVAYNDFDLRRGSAASFDRAGQFTRNVVRNATDVTAVEGVDAVVVSNTFLNLTRALAADTGQFRDNIVEGAQTAEANTSTGGGAPDGGGAYNFFYRVMPYAAAAAAPTDLVATTAVSFGPDVTPQPGSPVIDAADPSLPVPAGGGRRADIGAREQGAVRLADGRFCAPDAG